MEGFDIVVTIGLADDKKTILLGVGCDPMAAASAKCHDKDLYSSSVSSRESARSLVIYVGCFDGVSKSEKPLRFVFSERINPPSLENKSARKIQVNEKKIM
jgi:hypothetical protein